eukprot:1150440-Pelagomonas_calceolata.AAC.1
MAWVKRQAQAKRCLSCAFLATVLRLMGEKTHHGMAPASRFMGEKTHHGMGTKASTGKGCASPVRF